MEKQGFVYMWTNKVNGKKYIGSHYGFLDDGYISSGNYFNECYIKNTQEFSRKILYDTLSREDALSIEQKILCEIDAADNEEYYNLHNYSGRGWAHHDNPDLRSVYYQRISESKKGKPAWAKGKKLWGDHNLHKISDNWLVNHPDGKEEYIMNMSQFCRDHNLNPSSMSAVSRGKRRHYKQYRCRKITNNRNVPYEYNEWQSKGKPGKAMFGSDNPFSKSIEINGMHYGSMKEASEETGLSMYKLRKLRNE
jgi:hypothetical protein